MFFLATCLVYSIHLDFITTKGHLRSSITLLNYLDYVNQIIKYNILKSALNFAIFCVKHTVQPEWKIVENYLISNWLLGLQICRSVAFPLVIHVKVLFNDITSLTFR